MFMRLMILILQSSSSSGIESSLSSVWFVVTAGGNS